MKKILFLIIGLFLCHNAYAVVPNIFANDTVADALLVNENFDYFEAKFSTTGGHIHNGSNSKYISQTQDLDITGDLTISDDIAISGDLTIAGSGFFSSELTVDGTAVFSGNLTSTGSVYLDSTVYIANIPLTATGTELNYTDGVTSALQTQLDAKMDDGEAAGGDLTGTYPNPGVKASNVVFTWNGNEGYAANDYGMNVSTTQNVDVNSNDTAGYINFANETTTYRTFLNFKFKKVAGVDTVTIHARIWSSATGSTQEAVLNVDIGGASNTVNSTTSDTPSWVTSSDINVSGLTDGTVYNGIVQLKSEQALVSVYCSAVTLISS